MNNSEFVATANLKSGRGSAVLATILLTLSLTSCLPGREETGGLLEARFDVPDRVWAGSAFYANRLQDWRIRNGRLESVEGRAEKPMRTVHLLTRSAATHRGTLALSVTTGAIDRPDSTAGGSSWTGFLIGAGGDSVDYRISALVHHWPAADGGLIVGVDGTGRIVARDNSGNYGYSRPLRDIPIDSWTSFEPVLRTGTVGVQDLADGFRLSVRCTPSDTGYDILAVVSSSTTGVELARAIFRDIPADRVDGSLALVSQGSLSSANTGYWFDNLRVAGSKVAVHDERAFGPVLGAFHTLSGGTLKMTAQFGPIGPEDNQTAVLEIRSTSTWTPVATALIQAPSYTALFRVDNWTPNRDTPYRIVYRERESGKERISVYEGVIRKPPSTEEDFVLAAMNCQNISGGNGQWNRQHFWYPHAELTTAVANQDPDMLFFAGDQIYEAGLEGIVRAPVEEAMLDYLNHWYRFVLAFGDLARDRPAVIIPDDHDVYHGNIWGNGGVQAEGEFSPPADAGGYVMPVEWVNMVHRTQVSHLPDPYDATPLVNQISVYYTRMEYAGLSFAIIGDRMFKSPPKILVPDAEVWNGWPQRRGYDARDADVPGAELLGDRQLTFLDEWANDWSSDAWVKVLLSQTLFSNLATLPAGAASGAVLPDLEHPRPGEYPSGDRLADDMDSNAWPQSGRNEALRTIRKGFAFHVAGDQHLGSFVHYGIDDWGDAGNAFVVPSIANIWPRRWFPPMPGLDRDPYAPRYTGNYFDGFGNRMTVLAVANPVKSGHKPAALYDRSPGYGIIRFHHESRDIESEAWPRWADPTVDPTARQYLGWPVTVSIESNYGRKPAAWLETLVIDGIDDPVIQVRRDDTGEIVYTRRIRGNWFRPPVFAENARYTVSIGDGFRENDVVLRGLRPVASEDSTRHVSWPPDRILRSGGGVAEDE